MNIAPHAKYAIDNIKRKILCGFFRYIYEIIRRNSKEKLFLKKFSYRNIIFSRVYIGRLYKKKLVDIFKEFKITEKYPKHDEHNEYDNRKIIEKMYEEKKEINVIKILELTFEEVFIIFRKSLNNEKDKDKLKEIEIKIDGLDLLDNNDKYPDIQCLIKHLRDRNEDENYIKNIIDICSNFEK